MVSLLAASFASTALRLVATQGVLRALGGSLLYSPVTIWLDEWFVLWPVALCGLALAPVVCFDGAPLPIIPHSQHSHPPLQGLSFQSS